MEVSKNTSVDAGDTGDSHHLWLHALPRFKTELRCVPSHLKRGGAPEATGMRA